MSVEGSAWHSPFSPALEEFIIHHSENFSGNLKNPNTADYKLASRLTVEEIEAWSMWIHRGNGILPTQYHWSYEQGDTIIYPEHLADISVVDKMWTNRTKYREGKAAAEQKQKEFQKQMKSGQKFTTQNKGGSSSFFGKKYHYTK